MKRFIRKVFHRQRGSGPQVQLDTLYRERDYLEAYAEHTNMRVAEDPHAAVGGKWEEVGRLQLDFLLRLGLQSCHTLLDIGCGTLRGGHYFIRYLDPGNYTGIDISTNAIEHAWMLVHKEGLSGRNPRLFINCDLRFGEFAGEAFDFILAQSVFTHLPKEYIEECFGHVIRVMTPQSKFCFTFNRGNSMRRIGVKDFVYPLEMFEKLARSEGLRLTDASEEYGHPRGQSMVVAEIDSGSA